MKIWGKIIGGICGFLVAGPFGLFLGVFIGHLFDRGLHVQWQHFRDQVGQTQQAQQAFFNATFSVMGHIAKADGRVSEVEIRAARQAMDRMGLSELQRQRAIELFEQGKSPDFSLNEALTQLMQACHSNKVLLRLFVELQTQTAMAEGRPTAAKQYILQTIYQRLGFAPVNSNFFEDLFANFQHQYQQHQRGQSHGYQHSSQRPSSGVQLNEAYTILGVTTATSNADLKKAYRRLMSQHHPDKLMAKGLPEEMVKLATEKTQKIQAAYEKICAARGIK